MKKLILHLTAFALITLNCIAQPGTLDNTFGTGGIVSTAVGNFNLSMGATTAIQSDNKIVVGGYSYDGTNFDFALVRYNSDGSLDNTFGTGGMVITPVGNSYSFCDAVAIQSDNKIVAAGTSYNGANYVFALARYKTDGTLDSSFGSYGTDTASIGSGYDETAFSIAMQSDNKIVAAGYSFSLGGGDILMRFNTDGTLDNTFGTGGQLVIGFGELDDEFKSVAIQSDGKIVGAGYTADTSGNYYFAIFRFNSDGSVDGSFDSPYGAAAFSFGTNVYNTCSSIAIQSDGKIVMAGETSSDGTYYNTAVARIDSSGKSLDAAFGSGQGAVITAADANNSVSSVMIQSNGQILVAGSGNDGLNGSGNVFELIRYTGNGTLDSTFGADADGQVLTNVGATAAGNSMAIQSDGKIVVAGSDSADGVWNFAVVRYNGDVITGIKETGSEQFAMAVYPNPATNQLTIYPVGWSSNGVNTTSFHNEAVMVSVLNALGQIALSSSFSFGEGGGEALDVSGLSAGIYFLQMKWESGSAVKMFVKE